jgi:hypothetical protein
MRWALLFAIGAIAVLAITQPRVAFGLLAIALLVITLSMLVVAWSYFRLSRINAGQVRTPWPPPPPPITEQPLQGPPVDWYQGQPTTGWRSWWPRFRDRFGGPGGGPTGGSGGGTTVSDGDSTAASPNSTGVGAGMSRSG